ncbi:hypothetical protein BT69DRAFT_1294899 [Atractiella rhizophila]|nr:hypothetical protein BT69DRAFT_1294899 [Atractiella rhizophila]
MESSAGTTGLIIDGVPSILRVRMVYRYALDELVGTEDFRRTQPLRNTFSNLSQWEDAMECWEAGNAKAVAIVLANLDLTAVNQLSEEEKRVASSIVARMQALYSTMQAVMGHTIIAKLITFYQSGSGCTSLAQFITKWNAIYAELLSADSAYTLSDAVRFLLFVNLLEPEWRKFALNPKNVTRNDLNDLFQKLKAEDSRSLSMPPSSQPIRFSPSSARHFPPASSATLRSQTPTLRHPSTPPYRPSLATTSLPRILVSTPPVAPMYNRPWSVRPPTLRHFGKTYHLARRVYGHPGTRVFGRRAWDYDGIDSWPGSISPSGHFIVQPNQCVYCLGIGHISSSCRVPVIQREKTGDAAFEAMGITLQPNSSGRSQYVHPSVLIASPAFASPNELNSDGIPRAANDIFSPGPDGRYDGNLDGKIIHNGDLSYWPSYVQVAYEQRRWPVPLPAQHPDLDIHPLFLPLFSHDNPVPSNDPHFHTHVQYAPNGDMSFDRALQEISDQEYLNFMEEHDTTPGKILPSTSPSALLASTNNSLLPSLTISTPSVYDQPKFSSNLSWIRNCLPLTISKFVPFNLPQNFLRFLESPASIAECFLPVDYAANVAALHSTTLSNLDSTTRSNPFTSYFKQHMLQFMAVPLHMYIYIEM